MEELTHAVIGAAMEVHRSLGPGFLESVYEEALAREFDIQEIDYERQYPVSVTYKGHVIGEGRLDFLVARELIVELKTVDSLAPIHTAQTLSYLRMTGLSLALLINFKVALLKDGIKRVVLD